MNTKPKVAFIVQRSGNEVNGGAETECSMIAQLMSDCWDVEILTTCALDYMTWQNYYPEGVEAAGNVKIRRFKVDYPRNIKKFNDYSNAVFSNLKNINLQECEQWMKLQGPMSSKLLDYISAHKRDYEALIFLHIRIAMATIVSRMGSSLDPRSGLKMSRISISSCKRSAVSSLC